MVDKIIVYKGTDKNLRCRGYQFEIGKTAKDTDAVRCRDKGFHACEAPLDVLRYYALKDGNRYFEAEAGGKIDRTDADDSKVAASEMMLKEEIGLKGLIDAHFEYTRKKAESGQKGGDYSNLAGGDYSNLAGGGCSNLAGGDSALIVGRTDSKARGGKNSVLVLTAWEWQGTEYVPTCVKAVIVDGENVKADTWYQFKDGEIVEVEE